MAKVSDISFECPHCHGPLMAETTHVGMTCDCPHCYAQFQVPEATTVNKDKFVEPKGLRRVLQQVRDQEWEMLRRKLRAAKAHNAELEAELHRVQASLADRSPASKSSDDKSPDTDSLRKQLADLNEQFVQANQAFTAGRKQQDMVIDNLRRDLGAARDETAILKKKNEELARILQGSREEMARVRGEKSNELTAEIDRLRTELTETRSSLEAEQAKVLVMEAAGMSTDLPINGEAGDKNEALVRELQGQVSELRKSNDSLRAARDKVHGELAELKERCATNDDENQHLEVALSHLEDGLNEVLELITTRRTPKKAK